MVGVDNPGLHTVREGRRRTVLGTIKRPWPNWLEVFITADC